MSSRLGPGASSSLLLAALAFGIDRVQKGIQVSPDCIDPGQARCVELLAAARPLSATGWHGGEILHVTPFFDYLLVWNTGISYSLLSDVPVPLLGLVMAVAVIALAVWWWRSKTPLIRAALGLAIGGALSNGLDRLLYGAVADFFHFHWGATSFYIFNLADAAITLGVMLLLLDLFGIGRRAP